MHLDLVSFPRPVCIQEVRVIPAGHRVHAAVSEREKMGYVGRHMDSVHEVLVVFHKQPGERSRHL